MYILLIIVRLRHREGDPSTEHARRVDYDSLTRRRRLASLRLIGTPLHLELRHLLHSTSVVVQYSLRPVLDVKMGGVRI